MLISVIIPVYNVEKYLSKCLDSVLNQDINNCEIILIDDGSTDNSLQICNKYANKYNFIHVIHKENEGVSIARNIGIQNSIGEFIMFLDSDDLLENGIIKKLKKQISINKNIEIYTCDICKFDNYSNEILYKSLKLKEGLYKKNEFLFKYYKCRNMLPWSIGQNLFKTSIVKKNNIRFPNNIKVAEDTEFYMQYLSYINMIYFVKQISLKYRINRDGSATYTKKLDSTIDIHNIYSKYCYCKDKLISKCFSNLYTASMTVGIIKLKNDNEKEILKNKLDMNIINNSGGIKCTILKILYKIFGVEGTIKIIELIKK